MCNFASIVLTRDKELYLLTSDSHTDIIERFGVHEDGSRGPNILRVEISPPSDLKRFDDYSRWQYKIDQDLMPEWFDPKADEERAREALKRRAAEGWGRIVASGCTALTQIDAPAAEVVNVSGCTALTQIDAPAAERLYARECTALTQIDAPAATYLDASGCTALTQIDAPAARIVVR